MTNTLTLKPLMMDEGQVTFMTGHLEATHGLYKVSLSTFEGDAMVTLEHLWKKNVFYTKVFLTLNDAMTAMLTMKFEDERFNKIGE